MSRLVFVLQVVIAFVAICNGASQADALEITGKAAVLIDRQNGNILWSKNPDRRLPPASTAKILTALIVLQRSRLADLVTAPKGRGAGSAGRLKPGERLTVAQLLHALLLESDNDAASALAAHAAGQGGFAALMNREARRLGASNSRFANATGLPAPRQYTTARDLAAITRAAMEHPEFRQIVATKKYRWEGEKWLNNSNRLLDSYAGAVGVKTGSTREAGFCLVAAAERSGRSLIAVVLGSTEDAVWRDATVLLDFGFDPQR